MTEIVTFDLDQDSSSIERARETPVEVTTEPWGASYLAAFEDSDDVHEVILTREPDGWHGDCWSLDENGERTGRCRGWVHHDGPCAHLWAVRSHVAYERLADEDARHDLDVERARADGGERR